MYRLLSREVRRYNLESPERVVGLHIHGVIHPGVETLNIHVLPGELRPLSWGQANISQVEGHDCRLGDDMILVRVKDIPLVVVDYARRVVKKPEVDTLPSFFDISVGFDYHPAIPA